MSSSWVFVMVLGHSRHRFDRVVFDQKQETWCEGKVENGVRYVKNNALKGREGEPIDEVNAALIGEKVWVKATGESVLIYADDERVATHQRRGSGPHSTVEEHLPEGQRELRHRSQSFWQERADALGPETGKYVKEVFDSDNVLYQLRAVQGIVTHLETYPRERAEAACRRASYYGIATYQGIKNILTKALDREPLPTSAVTVAWADRPRFARDASDFSQEVSHERH